MTRAERTRTTGDGASACKLLPVFLCSLYTASLSIRTPSNRSEASMQRKDKSLQPLTKRRGRRKKTEEKRDGEGRTMCKTGPPPAPIRFEERR